MPRRRERIGAAAFSAWYFQRLGEELFFCQIICAGAFGLARIFPGVTPNFLLKIRLK